MNLTVDELNQLNVKEFIETHFKFSEQYISRFEIEKALKQKKIKLFFIKKEGKIIGTFAIYLGKKFPILNKNIPQLTFVAISKKERQNPKQNIKIIKLIEKKCKENKLNNIFAIINKSNKFWNITTKNESKKRSGFSSKHFRGLLHTLGQNPLFNGLKKPKQRTILIKKRIK